MSKLWTPFDLAVVLLRWSAIEILAIKSKIAIITRCVLILFILTTVSVRFNNYFRYFIVVPSSIKCYILWSEVFVYIERLQTLNKSASSLWLGPRQCGKSTLIRHMLSNEKYFEIDLLKSEYFRRYLSSPEQFRKDVEFQINKKEMKYFFIDEIQKIPELTNEIHFLIEKYKSKNVHFILSGPSARKLKRGHANLLGGRAVLKKLFSLHSLELKENFDLNTALQFGTLAGIYFEGPDTRIEKLYSYLDLYLKEEIAQEGIVRNLDLFNRFFDIVGIYCAEIINYTNIGRECGVSVKTVQNYFSILNETLLSFELPVWDKSLKRQLSKHSKFYMCDNGITNSILRNLKDNLRPEVRGKMFEQWLINEIRNFSIYAQSDYEFHFWRTERGEFEVDLILSKKSKPLYAIEIKAKKKIVKKDLTSLLEFQKENSLSTLILLYEGEQAYSEGDILILPYYEIWDELVAKKKRAL